MRKFDAESQAIIDGLPEFSGGIQKSDMVKLLGAGELYEWNNSVPNDTLLVSLLYATLINMLVLKSEVAKVHMSKIVQALRSLGE